MTLQSPIYYQIGPNTPTPSGLDQVTTTIFPPLNLQYRLRSFSPYTYDLSNSSHIVRLMSVLLGDAGGEQIRKRQLYARLRSVMPSTNFLDLDAFWGALFKLNRTPSEELGLNPYSDSTDIAGWISAHQSDASYRDRIFQFAQGIQFGASPVGIQQVAEAVLSCRVDLYEEFAAHSYLASIIPHRVISLSELFNLKNILDTIKPVDSIITISQGGLTPTSIVPIQQAWASSSYWEISSLITPGPNSLFDSPTPKPQWAFSGYQGESWTLNSTIVNVTSQEWDQFLNVTQLTDFNHIVWPDGTYTNYTPELSVEPVWESLLGKMAQSGITVANPVNNQNTTSPVLVDGMPMDQLSAQLQSLNLNEFNITSNYWASIPKFGNDPSYDVVTYQLSGGNFANSLSLEIANFPQQVLIQLQENNSGTWVTSLVQNITHSTPSQIPNSPSLLANHQDPQYSDPQSWVPLSIQFTPADIQGVRLIFQRINVNNPTDSLGNPVAYSLGIKDLDLEMVIGSTDQIPIGGGQIGSVTNILGDQVSYSVYNEDPSAPVMGTGQWRCAPQVTPAAVVNYYLDMRDQYGSPQVVDGFNIVPTHLGVHATLYWTTDQPTQNGQAIDNPFPGLASAGTLTNIGTGLSFGANTSISVPASNIRMTGDWWIGITFTPPNASAYSIWSFGNNTLAMAGGAITLTLATGQTLSYPIGLLASGPVSIVVGQVSPDSDSDLNLSLTPSNSTFVLGINDQVFTIVAPYISNLATLPLEVGGSSTPAGFILQNLVVKGETLLNVTIAQFMSSPRFFCYKGQFPPQDQGGTINAYVRFDVAFVSTSNPTGFVGGVPDIMGALMWSPIANDFTMTRGIISLEPRAATFWKFELTNLVAQPYSVYIPANPTNTQLFASTAVSPNTGKSGYQGAVTPGSTSTAAQFSGQPIFNTTAPIMTPPDPRLNSPTTTLVSTNPSVTSTLASAFFWFGSQTWQQGQSAPLQPLPAIEYYHQVTSPQTDQWAFFCGFISLQALRTNIGSYTDTTYYKENFLDTLDFSLGPG